MPPSGVMRGLLDMAPGGIGCFDPAGRVVPSNITILEATAPEFEASVRSAATAFRFEAARKFGRQVYQVFCMPVTFRLQPGNDREARHLDSLATQWGKDGVCPSNEMRRPPNER